jgi:hypothetical protein
MADHIESIKSLAQTYRRLADANDYEKPDLSKKQTALAEALEQVAAELVASRIRLRSVSNALGDLSDLPPEVLAELSVTKLDDLEQQMRDIVASGADEVGLDVVIVELYRRHKVVHPRRFVMNKLYRMAQKGLIYGVEGKKGVYTVVKPPSSRSAAFFDDLNDDVPF